MNPRSPSLRERFREQARAELLDAARRVFEREGFDGRVDAIAAEAGVSVGTVYNVFGDRAGLVRAVMDQGRQEIFGEVRLYLERTTAHPFEERLRAVVHLLLGHLRAHWSTLRLLIQGVEAVCPAGGGPQPHVIREIHAFMSTLVQDGVDRGAIVCDVHVATCALLGAIRTTIDVDLALGLDAPSEDRADQLIQLFLDGARPAR